MTNRIPRSLSLFPIFAIAAMIIAISSCYTILRHPKIIDADYERPSNERCVTCHTEDEIWLFHHPTTRYDGSYFHYWQPYYHTPWWYDDYWFYTDSDDPETIPLHRRSLRPTPQEGMKPETRARVILPPSGKEQPKSTESVKEKSKEADDKESSSQKKRSLRPKPKKKKKDG